MSNNGPKLHVLVRIVACALILALGFFGMKKLAAMKEAPAVAEYREPALRVETTIAKAEPARVTLSGHGEILCLRVVEIAPEVGGRVVQIHPGLEVGEVVEEGALLFAIDPTDYQLALLEARSQAAQAEAAIERLRSQQETDGLRLQTFERNRELARTEYERYAQLLAEKDIGARSQVERLEQAFNAVRDQVDLTRKSLDLYPIQIKEATAGLAAARSRVQIAETRLARCRVVAPFRGRLKSVSLEAGQYVSPGQPLVSLADDSRLEIHLALDAREAKMWLPFREQGSSAGWFGTLQPLNCQVSWTEAPERIAAGVLDRVVSFEASTRTLTVAVRLKETTAAVGPGLGLPLVEGMFCKVDIPGRQVEDVFSLPDWAVSFSNTVYLAVDDRLHTKEVLPVRTEKGRAYVRGLQDGDQVIVTRLVEPLENSLLEIITPGESGP